MFRDSQATIAKLQTLRERGVRIAIDDFGTGYASLTYLRRFPVDIIKIAQEFIARADADNAGVGLHRRDPGARPAPRPGSDRRGRRGCAAR